MMKRILQAALLMLAFAIPSNAVRVFERSTVANLPMCGTATEGLAFYVTDAADSEDCVTGASTVDNVCICSGGVWSNDVFDIPLNEVLNPTGNKTFQMTTDMLKFSFTNPNPTGNYEGAFEIEATANFGSGAGDQDLVHIHQHTGNAGAMFGLHLETADVDAFPMKIVGAHSGGLNLMSDEGIESDARFQLGSTTAASASCASLDTDRWYGDKDCDETKDVGEEYFDLTGGGASITLDLGDDGGNDSTALAEIATSNDNGSAITESSADKMLIDVSKLRPPSILNPRASPDSNDCEFSGSMTACTQWTLDASYSSGTVDQTAQKTSFIYDFSSWSGWLLMQGDNTSATYQYTDNAHTPADEEMWVFHIVGSGLVNATNEGRVGLCYRNSGDANEGVCLGYHSASGSERWELYCENNGAVSASSFLNSGAEPLSDSVLILYRDTNVYTMGIIPVSGGGGHTPYYNSYMSSSTCTKTGVTTFDTVSVVTTSANEAISPIVGIDFIRYYSPHTFAIMNP